MKIYTDSRQLRMVGKAWEIKAKLRELSRTPITLQQYLHVRKGR